MANQLEITSAYKNSAWSVTSRVTDDSDEDFPRDIFLWTLDSEGALDQFKAIGHVDQIARYKLYDSERTSNFGIHLVRHNSSTTSVATEEEKDSVITVLKSAFTILLNGYELASQSTIEVYP